MERIATDAVSLEFSDLRLLFGAKVALGSNPVTVGLTSIVLFLQNSFSCTIHLSAFPTSNTWLFAILVTRVQCCLFVPSICLPSSDITHATQHGPREFTQTNKHGRKASFPVKVIFSKKKEIHLIYSL